MNVSSLPVQLGRSEQRSCYFLIRDMVGLQGRSWSPVRDSEGPKEVKEQPVLFIKRAGGIVDLFGLHVTQIDEERVVGVIAGDDLMSTHVSSAPGREAKVIVVETAPDRRCADVFVVI